MHTKTEIQQTNEVNEDAIYINQKQIKRANFIMKSVNSPIRQRIINLLLVSEKLAVHELCKEMQMAQSVMSQHLSVLRKAKLVKTYREGKEVFYSINEDHLTEIIEFVKQLSNK